MTLIHRLSPHKALARLSPILLAALLAACATTPAPTLVETSAAPLSPPAAAAVASATTTPAPTVPVRTIAAELLEDNLRPGEKIDLDNPEVNADLWARVRKGFQLQDLDDDWVRAVCWHTPVSLLGDPS